MAKTTPSIIFKSRFVLPKNKHTKGYTWYIDDYMTRTIATEKKYDSYVDCYMDNSKKTIQDKYELDINDESPTCLFTEEKDNLTIKEKEMIKKKFKLAQENESPLWQNVISFDNKFLKKNGVLDKNDKMIDENKIKNITRSSMRKLLKSEDMDKSAVWSASMHYNTGNIHVHIAVAEPHPTRKKVMYKGKESYRGKYKQSSINKTKSVLANGFCDRSEELNYINKLIRENIHAGFKSYDIEKDKILLKKLNKLEKSMPLNKRLWKYNMNAMKEVRPLINDITDTYITLYHMEDYNQLISQLIDQDKFNKKLYGEKSNGKYMDNKLDEMYTRMGNTTISFLKNRANSNSTSFNQDKTKQTDLFSKAEKRYRGKRTENSSKNNIKKGGIPKVYLRNKVGKYRNLNDLKRFFNKDFNSIKNLRKHKELQMEIEQIIDRDFIER